MGRSLILPSLSAHESTVIGGGPKAAAIAAKAAAMSSVGYSPPEIHIFEHIRLGAAWRGKSGYTDGLQPVCTLAERDLGFPYDRNTFGVRVARTMMSEFSWSAYTVRDGTDHTQYREWVLHGRQPPRHVDFADYLERSIRLSGARHINGEVVALDYGAGAHPWTIDWNDKGSPRTMDFDGVVITGSGSPLPPLRNANGRVFDGKSFWTQIPQVLTLLKADPDPAVVIIGAGGTGAAIALWFIQNVKRIPISIIGREPTLYTRHAGYFEDRLFTDDLAWSTLPAHMRDVFVGRLTSGVVWDYVMRALTSGNVKYECFSVIGYQPLVLPIPSGGIPELGVELSDTPDPSLRPPPVPVVKQVLPATVIIDARGFDPRWFVGAWLNGPLQAHFSANRPALQNAASPSLCVGSPTYPRLHIPRLASRQGPGASNLMALGWMADRILMEYIPATQIVALSQSAPGSGT